MLLRIMSDLHLEFGNPFVPPPMPEDGETVLILAGDIATGTNAVPWIREQGARFRHVIYVSGNHELYHNRFDLLHAQIKEQLKDLTNVSFLHNEEFLLDNVVFLGSTLWTDMNKKNSLTRYRIENAMNDYNYISIERDGEVQRIQSVDILTAHDVGRQFILNSLENAPSDHTVVVVTHHAPSYKSVHRRYERDGDINFAYHSDLDFMFHHFPVKLWVHGHTHTSFDYSIGSGRVVCNPFGYFRYDPNPDFDPLFRVEV